MTLEPRFDVRPAEPSIAANANVGDSVRPRRFVDPRRLNTESDCELSSRQESCLVASGSFETDRCCPLLCAHACKEREPRHAANELEQGNRSWSDRAGANRVLLKPTFEDYPWIEPERSRVHDR